MADNETRAMRNLGAGILALILIVILGVSFKFLLYHTLHSRMVESTSASGSYTSQITVCGDSFAGYAIVRSPAMKRELASKGIRLNWKDDAADYGARAKAVRAGDCDFAVNTIDADLVTGEGLGEFPGSIIFIIDESHGADGVVAYKTAVPNVQALNQNGAKIVVTSNSPSETLARQMISGMLPILANDQHWLEAADGAEAVYKQLSGTKPNERKAFVLWEPWLSKALEIDGVQKIYDSSATTATIVDVMMVSRSYLSERADLVNFFTQAYFRSLWSYTSQPSGLRDLVMEDAQEQGSKLTNDQALATVAGIRWKNTLENYAHMGLVPRFEAKGIPNMEDMVSGISRFLVRTGKLVKNPVEGREQELYYDTILRQMQASKFHPGGEEQMHGASELPALAADQWEKLMVVGNLDAKSIAFARGSASLSPEGVRDAREIGRLLKGWPNYYITVEGHARADAADQVAAGALAQNRARSVGEALQTAGVSKNRIRAIAKPSTQSSGEGQSVTFTLAQKSF